MKIWNQSRTVKFDPADVARHDIRKPNQPDYSCGGMPLHKFKLELFMKKDAGATISYGYYSTKAAAEKASDLLDILATRSGPEGLGALGESSALRIWLEKELQRNRACLESKLSLGTLSDYLGQRTALLKVRDKMDGLLEEDKAQD